MNFIINSVLRWGERQNRRKKMKRINKQKNKKKKEKKKKKEHFSEASLRTRTTRRDDVSSRVIY